MSHDDDFEVAIEEATAISVAVALPPTIDIKVATPEVKVVAADNAGLQAGIEVVAQEPLAVVTAVTLPPVIGISSDVVEVPVIAAANTGPRGAQGEQGIQGAAGPAGPPAVWVELTQAEYNALAVKDPNTLYIITDSTGTPPDTTAPTTTITSGPGNSVATSADVSFTSNDPQASFEGRLDAGSWVVVTSPVHLTGLTVGNHTYEVRAKDLANNIDQSPASVTWQVLADPHIRITTTGSTFSPWIELYAGSLAEVSWFVEETNQTIANNPTPVFNFGSAATRHVQMRVLEGSADALEDVAMFNVGFNHNDDAGRYNMGEGYDWPGQTVSAVENVNLMNRLVRFAAANTSLASVLDFSGCALLEFIECFRALVRGVNLNGCSSLIRLCLEQCDQQQPLNLNPVAATLRDLRAAAMRGGSLTFVAQTVPLAVLYHECIRDQTVINRPANTMIPVVFEEWIWSTGQSGPYVTASHASGSLAASGNAYTSADLTGRFPAGVGGVIDFSSNQLSSINLTGCEGAGQFYLANNLFNQAAVDAILTTIDGWNTTGAWIYLDGNAAPSAAGLVHVNNLRGRGWEVTVSAAIAVPANTIVPTVNGTARDGSTLTADPGTWSNTPTGYSYQWQSSDDGVAWSDQNGVIGNTKSIGSGDVGKRLRVRVIASNAGGPSVAAFSAATAIVTSVTAWPWIDDFERPDATGLAAVGNGWATLGGGADASIVNGNLVRTEILGYQRLVTTGDGLAPANYTVETVLPQWDTLGWTYRDYFGLMLRHEAGVDDGIRALFGGGLTDLRIGSSGGYNVEDQPLGTVNYPASWTDMGALSHTFALRVVGNQVSVLLDGALAVTITYARQVGHTGTAFGFCGEGNGRAYRSFRAYAS